MKLLICNWQTKESLCESIQLCFDLKQVVSIVMQVKIYNINKSTWLIQLFLNENEAQT